MKKPLLRIISTLCICCMMLLQCSAVRADETPSISKVIATYAETERDVLTQVLEVEAGVMADLNLEVVLDNSVSGLTYKVYQYNGSTKQKYELVSSGSNKFSIEAEKLKSDIPLYLAVYKNNTNIITKLLTVRVNPGRAQLMFPESYASTYTENIQVDMSELLPGMKFQMHPYVLPITCQAYTDGRIIIGMGINSSNVNFWKNARNGTLNEKTNVKELSDAFWGKSSNKSAVKGRDLGLVVEFSGWVQGNIYTTEPMKGELSVYIGSGFDVTGQYAILTWEVTVTIGVNGAFDFELRYTDKTGKYDDFHADSFAITFKTGLELYGGLGLSSIASVGLYGSGYIGVKDQFYPDPVVQSLVLAGECGFKVKAFSRTLFSFAIVSGSHDFVKKNLTADDGANSSFLGTSYIDSINSTLVSQNYANMSGAINEPDSNGTWYTGLTALTGSEGSLTEYETDPNFDHKIAENIYPDNRLQVVNTSKDARQMNIIFLGSDSSRTNGNRSRLMNFYFKEEDNYLSEPVWIFSINDYDYANTADYDPYVYHMEKSEKTGNIEKTYMVWRSSTKTFAENATFEEIAKNTDVFFTEYDPASNSWSRPYRITEYAVWETSELFACGASVSAAKDGSPQITYYTSPVTDPAGIDETAERIVFFESFDGTYWNREDVCTVTGSITRVDSAYYKGNPCVAVSYSYMENGEKKYTVELWQRGDSWQKIYTFDGSMNALFTDCGNGTSLLTWYKDGRVYGMLDDQDFTRAITQEDIKVPSSDYRIYGTYVTGQMAIIGTVSSESSENAFAIISKGGLKWGKVQLTDVGENAIVNELGFAYTYPDPKDPDSDREPIVFYSVQNYVVNDNVNMDYLKSDADTFLNSPLQSGFTGLGSAGLMIGMDDPRFTDTTTDLYVKARKANESIRIKDITFTNEDGARKGKPTPVKIEIENTGMYDLSMVTVYAQGIKVNDYYAPAIAGNTNTIETEVIVPENAGNEPLSFEFRVVTEDKIAGHTATATLGTGHIAVLYTHQLRYGIEGIRYTVTNNGFANKTVYAYMFDEATGKNFSNYPLGVYSGTTQSGLYSSLSGLLKQDGHQNVRAYIITEEEKNKLPADVTMQQMEELLDMDSTNSVLIKGLDEIYLQDVTNVFKSTVASDPEPEPEPEPSPAPAPQETAPAPSTAPSAPSSSGQEKSDEQVAEPPKTEEPKETVPDDNDTGEDIPAVSEEPPVPEDQGEPDGGGKKKRSYIVPVLAGSGILFLGLAFFLFFLFKRRDEDEEDENGQTGGQAT